MQSKAHSLIITCAVLLAVGCGERFNEGALTGEWKVVITEAAGRAGSVERRWSGVMVFSPEIPCYCDEDTVVPEEAVFGRAYLPAHLRPSDSSTSDTLFAMGRWGDLIEEAVGLPGPRDSVKLYVRPGPIQQEFLGVWHGDAIAGAWVMLDHGARTGVGQFRMWRVPPSEFSDSARVRATRGIQMWRTPGTGPTSVQEDTVSPVSGGDI